MQNVSVDFIKQLNNDNRAYLLRCEIVLTDGTALSISNENLWSDTFKIEDAVSNSGNLDIGAAITNKLTFTLSDIYDEYSEYDFTDAVVRNVQVGLVLPDGTEEYVKKGEYTVDETSYNGSLITLECLDNMAKFDVSYSKSKLVYPATIGTIVRDACSICGVMLGTYEFPNHAYIVQERPSDEALTFRQVLNWCAQIACCFARCNAEGKLEIKWFQTGILENNLEGGTFDSGTPKYETGDAADGGGFNPWSQGDSYSGGTFQDLLSIHHFISYTSPSISTDDIVITGIQVKEYSSDVDNNEIVPCFVGTEGYILSIEENKFIPPGRGHEVATYLGSRLIGLRFRPLSFSCLSDPTLEAGDVGFFTDRKCKTYKFLVTSTTFASGNYQMVTCDAKTPERNKATRYTSATQAYVELRKQIRKERTEREKALEELSKKLATSSGLYTTIETPASGGKIFYMHDRPNLADSSIVWKMNAEAWGVSTDGGKNWNGGMTVDGDTIVRILTAIGVNASWIDTGRISVKDKDGNVIFLVDMDTKEIVISGDCVRIGAVSATEAIEEANNTANKALQEAEKMRALNIQLENDSHTVPTNYEGGDGNYAGCDTTVYVLWGQTDISADVPITVSKSAGITGMWNAAARKYTVTNMTTDTGYVDFTVKYMEITATKRFSISKNKQGRQGEQGPQGIPGKDGGDGTDGRTSYFHVMYSPVGNPTTSQMTKEPDAYIGTYVDFSETDSRDPLVYSWVKIEGVDGKDGTNGIPGKNGIDGKTSYLHIKYSDDGSTFTGNAGETPGKWIGQYVDFVQADSTVFSDYTWTKVQGPQGVQGPKGTDGKTYYTWIKYADDSSGKNMSDSPDGKPYIGLAYNKATASESTNPSDYTWSLIKGDKGNPGVAGRTYFIDASTVIIKRGQNGRISPTSVTFSAYYRDGDSSERTPYYGRFIISESVDGDIWEAKYTSAVDEISKEYVPTETATSVKCVLYAAGGTQTEMDQQTVSIVVDVSNLTQEIIFDTLTNNGENQGVYLNDGKIYINMTYAKGGTLVLGGLNDTNGLLQVRDESDKEIGHWGSDGIVIEKGSFTTKTDTSTASVKGGKMRVSFQDIEIGNIGANRFINGDQYSGLVFDLEAEGSYVGWAAKNKSTDTSYAIKFMYMHKNYSGYTAGNLYLGADLDTKGNDVLLNTGGILKSWTDASGFKTDEFSVVPSNSNTSYFRARASEIDCYTNLDMNSHSIYNQSDARLKDNITDVVSALNAINSIEIKSFDWLTDGRHVDAGIIAQQLQQVLPGLVREDEQGLLGVNYIGLIPYLAKAIQELYSLVIPVNYISLEEEPRPLYIFTEEEKMEAVEKAKPPTLEDVEPEEIIIEENI